MKPAAKLWLLGLLTLVAIAIVYMLPPVPLNPAYNDFADQRTFFGIPNFMNTISNFPFLLVGLAGLFSLKGSTASKAVSVVYAIMFCGIFFVSFGSAYYHYAPDNNTLVYDRIPMTIVFMSLLSATIAEFIDLKWGIRLLVPLLLVGVFSVWWWHYTELAGHGDQRLYGFVQFYPVLFIPLILLLFRSPVYNAALSQLIWVVIWYVIAKIFEHFDKQLYAISGVSGHFLKHLAAAVATWYLVRMFRVKYK